MTAPLTTLPQATGRRCCPLCGQGEATRWSHGTEPSSLVRCAACGVAFWLQPWSASQLSHYYRGYYDPATITYDPITEARYHALLDGIARWRGTGRLLDVGCGAGHFLTVAQARGWRTYGLEISEAALQFLATVRAQRGLQFELVDRNLAEADFAADSFDVVTMFEVIEHLDDPLSVLTEAHRILNKGGLMYVTTPNYNSLSRLLLGHRWRVIAQEHRCLVTVQALRRCLSRIGFRILTLRTKNIDLTELLAGRRRHRQATEPTVRQEAAQHWRHTVESTGWLRSMKHVANAFLRVSGLGDTIEVLAVKEARA